MKNILFLFSISLILNSCIISNPHPEDCIIQEIIITEISEGTSNDIVIKDGGFDYFYINRGLEKGLTLKYLNNTLLNKKVTLHLPKFWIGTSEHIAQLSIVNEIVYTEFSTKLGNN